MDFLLRMRTLEISSLWTWPMSVGRKRILLSATYLLLEVFQYLHSFPLHEIQLLQQLFHPGNLIGHRRAAFSIVLIQQSTFGTPRVVLPSAPPSTRLDHSSLE